MIKLPFCAHSPSIFVSLNSGNFWFRPANSDVAFETALSVADPNHCWRILLIKSPFEDIVASSKFANSFAAHQRIFSDEVMKTVNKCTRRF